MTKQSIGRHPSIIFYFIGKYLEIVKLILNCKYFIILQDDKCLGNLELIINNQLENL